MYIVYTDGSYQSSIDAGGYAAVILKDGKVVKKLFKGFKGTTNNRMELMGVLAALQYFKEPTEMTIYSDSCYIVNNYNGGHAKRWFEENDFSKKNLDLWHDILDLLSFHKATLIWVKGHADNTYNNMCDELAVSAARFLNIPQDERNNNKH